MNAKAHRMASIRTVLKSAIMKELDLAAEIDGNDGQKNFRDRPGR